MNSTCRLWRVVVCALACAGMFGVLACPLTGQAAPAPEVSGQARAGATTPARPARPAPPASSDEATLRKELAALEATRDALRALLTADPCAIPSEVGGVVLEVPSATPTSPAVSKASPPAQGSPATPATGNSGKSAPASADFRASPDAIDAATTLILTGNAMGTGFFVAPGIVATNRHVVEESPGLIILLNKDMGKMVRGRLLAIGRGDRDYALIKVESDAMLPEALPLCGGVRKTDKIASWGYPGALSTSDPKFRALAEGDLTAMPEGVYSEGVVNVVYENTPSMILHTATISQGNSGGPLVNQEGCVVGINTMIHLDDQSYRQTSIALAIGDLVAFMQQQGITPRYKPDR